MAQNPNLANLDQAQVINRVFDPLNDRLRVDASLTIEAAASQEVIITHLDDSIRLGDGVDLVTTTTVGSDVGLDVNIIAGSITGEFSVSGLHIGGRNTTMNITDTATVIPPVALADRNGITVTNLSLTDMLYVGFSSGVTADSVVGNSSGFQVGPQAGFNLDITEVISLYAIAETGKTVKIIITELA